MKRCQLQVEALEDRTVPAVFGVPWPDATHLTLSLVPDATSTPAGGSELYALLDSAYPREVWQHNLLLAFQTWAEQANINIGLVADSGAPLGADGVLQGDLRFGDIRLAAYPMSGEVVAVASPFDALAGTYSGDIKLNSSLTFGQDGYDLFSVLLHEAGHVFGLDHSESPDSALFESYTHTHTGLTAEDVTRIQALYGQRAPDAIDAKAPNDTLATAAQFKKSGSVFAVDADLTTRADVDWYSFRLTGQGSVTVRLNVSGLSLLSGRLSLYNEDGQLLGTADAGSAIGADLALRLTRSGADRTYFVKVEGATEDAFSVGSYHLELIPDGEASSKALRGQEQPGKRDDDPAHAVNLQQKVFRTDARFDHVVQASLDSAADVDYYKVHAPAAVAGGQVVLTGMVWGTDGSGLRPTLTLYNTDGIALATQVLVNEDGSFVIQAGMGQGGGTYLLAVRHAGGAATGNYFLGVDFGSEAVVLQPVVVGSVLNSGGVATQDLHVTQSQLFHFVLSAASGTGAVRTELIAPDGSVVGTLTAAAGTTVTDTLFLRSGDYVFRTTALGGPVTYSLRLRGLSDPIGPTLVDTTLTPPSSATVTSPLWDYGYSGSLAGAPSGTSSTTSSTIATTPLADPTVVEPQLTLDQSAQATLVDPTVAAVDAVFSQVLLAEDLSLSTASTSLTTLSTAGVSSPSPSSLSIIEPVPTDSYVQLSGSGSTTEEVPVLPPDEVRATPPSTAPTPTTRAGNHLPAPALDPVEASLSHGALPRTDDPIQPATDQAGNSAVTAAGVSSGASLEGPDRADGRLQVVLSSLARGALLPLSMIVSLVGSAHWIRRRPPLPGNSKQGS